LKKLLIVDWLDAYGGAERVIKSIQDIFMFEKTYTLICLMKQTDLFKIYKQNNPVIVETPIKIFGEKFRYFFFLFHFFTNRIKIPQDTDLIISSSHSIAKGVRKTSKKQLHISYFQARNFNYIWEDKALFFGKYALFFYPLIYLLRKIDIVHSKRTDFIVANSNFVKEWVKLRYNREAFVIYPPVDLSNFELNIEKEDFYVTVGRIVRVKRFDIVIEAFNKNKKKLFVIGDGQNLNELKKKANDNIIFTGFLETQEVKKYISKAKGLIQSGVEGFGIAPLEAQACGTPIIAYGEGGVLETVKNGETGVLFYEQTSTALIKTIQTFETMKFDSEFIRNEALKFSEERFKTEFEAFVYEKVKEHRTKNGL
jgi:glycosyltransferase involved in cell wall biosynthesis